jgi:ABC-type transport system involved in multi-copper enzyme maturation permease subunit
MKPNVGPGPVFAYEWLIGSRRWQVYAARSLFVVILLIGMAMVWRAELVGHRVSIRGMATAGHVFSETLIGIQLTLVLLAAPAATAGAVCLDKARGTLTHLLVTDLSNSEIVLGKLAARLVPVLGLVTCTVPVMLIASLMGGADPSGLLGAFLTSVGLACFGCALALTLSVWGNKTHEVLLMTYLVVALWLLAEPSWSMARWVLGSPWAPPDWFQKLNPYQLCYANDNRPGSVNLGDYVVFLLVCLVGAVALATLAVFRIRVVALRQSSRAQTASRRWTIPLPNASVLRRYLPGPSLDRNPVLWREWHRNQPSRWTRLCWGVYYLVGTAFGVLVIVLALTKGPGNPNSGMAAFTNGFLACIGLLLLTVSSATALSEERVRGSLDVLLATPLSTSSILLGKWWGAFRGVPFLCILPFAILNAFTVNNLRLINPFLLVATILAMGAAVTSLGLALATWVSRVGRAVAAAVTIYVLVTVGWLFLAMSMGRGPNHGELWAMASPFFGPGNLTFHGAEAASSSRDEYVNIFGFGWCVFYLAGAAVLYILTLVTFDRRLGRVSDSVRIAASPKKPVGEDEIAWELVESNAPL